MAEVIRYVDPDASGSETGLDWANAYTSLSAWSTAEETNLVNDQNTHRVICRASVGTADTTLCVISSTWYTSETYNLTIEAASTDRASKTGFDESKYRLDTVDGSGSFINFTNFITIDGLQFRHTYSSQASRSAISLRNFGSGSHLQYVKNCYIKTVGGDPSYLINGLQVLDTEISPTIENCVFEGTNDDNGIKISNGNVTKVNNCIVKGFKYGVYESVAQNSVEVTNCAIFDSSSQDWFGDVNYTTCVTDDPKTGSVRPFGDNWNNEFNDPTNNDFTLLTGGNCYLGGTPISGLTTDIEGDSYHVTTPSVGVDEFVNLVEVNLLTIDSILHSPSISIGAISNVGALTLVSMLYNVTVEALFYFIDSFGKSKVTKSKLPGKPSIVKSKRPGKPSIDKSKRPGKPEIIGK